jgi:AraC-like DNA-binding protein
MARGCSLQYLKVSAVPSSIVRSFTDPDDYATSIRAVNAELTVTARGRFEAKQTWIGLHDLWMQRFSENLPRVVHSAAGAGRTGMTFRTSSGPGLRWNRTEMDAPSFIRLEEGHDAFQRSSGPISFGSMSLPSETLMSVVADISGRDLKRHADRLDFIPPPTAAATLHRLHAEAGDLAENAPEIIACPESARGLRQTLVQAMVACLSTPGTSEDVSAQRRHEKIMRQFYAMIAEHPGEAIYIADICANLGVPERTLRFCCYEALGMSPKQYLVLRRMQLARQALRKADALATSVTGIACDLGFWNFGRFAVEYRRMFGESPSTTLHTPSQ